MGAIKRSEQYKDIKTMIEDFIVHENNNVENFTGKQAISDVKKQDPNLAKILIEGKTKIWKPNRYFPSSDIRKLLASYDK